MTTASMRSAPPAARSMSSANVLITSPSHDVVVPLFATGRSVPTPLHVEASAFVGHGRRGSPPPLVTGLVAEALESFRYLVFFLATRTGPFRVGPAGLCPGGLFSVVLGSGEGLEIFVCKAGCDS